MNNAIPERVQQMKFGGWNTRNWIVAAEIAIEHALSSTWPFSSHIIDSIAELCRFLRGTLTDKLYLDMEKENQVLRLLSGSSLELGGPVSCSHDRRWQWRGLEPKSKLTYFQATWHIMEPIWPFHRQL